MLALSALVAVLSLAFTGTASAQTSFQAQVKATITKPTSASCEAYCGTADIAGYGTATWILTVTSLTISQTSCGSTYAATTTFTLGDGSTLVVDEHGYVCAPGNDAAGFFSEGPNAYGHPNTPHGTWTVDTADSTGQFAGLSGGAGTDIIHAAGAHTTGSYSGTLG